MEPRTPARLVSVHSLFSAPQNEQERIAAEKVKQERIAAEKLKQERIAAEEAEKRRMVSAKDTCEGSNCFVRITCDIVFFNSSGGVLFDSDRKYQVPP